MGGFERGALAVMAEQVTGRGARGAVAAAAPIAAAVGAEVLDRGGNACDAAVAAALAETVLLPPKCGLGGDLVALRLRPGAAEPEALLAVGPAPAGLAAVVRERGLEETGPLSVGPPAAPAGYAALAAEGRLGLGELVEPAIRLARDGIVWSSICAWLGRRSAGLLRRHQPDGCTYAPGGEPLEAGAVVRLPGLARALEELGRHGADVLAGPLGDAIVDRVREAGGVLGHDDLAAARAAWGPAAAVDVAGWRVWATPAPTHGPALLDALASAPGLDPVGLWHGFREATARRRRSLGEPAPTGTSMVSACDDDGDTVVVVHSNSYPEFGSGLVVPGYDLVLANRAGRGFTAEAAHPNFPEPGRRPATTLHAWAAGPVDAGRPTHLGGTPGGANQVAWNTQLVAGLLGGEARPGHLVCAPRWEWLPGDDGLRIEEGYPAEVAAGLAAAATGPVEHVELWGLRSAQQVVEVPAAGAARVAAADPRTVGAVAAR